MSGVEQVRLSYLGEGETNRGGFGFVERFDMGAGVVEQLLQPVAFVDRLASPDADGRSRTVRVAPVAVALDTLNEVFNSGFVDFANVGDTLLALRCNQLSIPNIRSRRTR